MIHGFYTQIQSVEISVSSENNARSSKGEADDKEDDDCLNELPELEDEDFDDVEVDT